MPELLTQALHRRAELVHAIDALDWSTADEFALLLASIVRRQRSTTEAVWAAVVTMEHLQQLRTDAAILGRDPDRAAVLTDAAGAFSARLGFAALGKAQQREAGRIKRRRGRAAK